MVDPMNTPQSRPEDIAIIGMGCVFPESPDLKAFWNLLFNGKDAVSDVPKDSHWKVEDYFDEDPSTPDHTYCTRGGFIPPIAFDPLSYGIPPNNMDATDTAQLLGLEVARAALADAGYANHPDLQEKRVNVILGVTGTQELVIPLGARLGHPIWKRALDNAGIDPHTRDQVVQQISDSYVKWQENSFPGLLGNVVAGRIANRLNLSGTNAVSDAACASSLSAMHTAILELQTGKCDMSVTGGVDVLSDIFMHMCFSKTGVLSFSSDAKPFSKDADGTVLGEGLGMLVLKRLSDAEKANDRIYAVIKGMGTSSDGKTSAIYAPAAPGQKRALNMAYEQAGVDIHTVKMVEAHGTGTRVGDKVEFTALKSVFEGHAHQDVSLGSVKSMIGHTKAAAGAAGMIKTALALYHKVLPPTLKAEEPDPELEINQSPFYLNNRTKPWPAHPDFPRRSGISAFGFGGSNFHAVLEEYTPKKAQPSWDGSVQILAFCADDPAGIRQAVDAFDTEFKSAKIQDKKRRTQLLAHLAYNTRTAFDVKKEARLLMVVKPGDNLDDLLAQARTLVQERTPTKAPIFFQQGPAKGKLGFLFPGQGSQYTDMGRDLFGVFPEAMEALESAQTAFKARNPKAEAQALNDFIFPLPPHAQAKKEAEDALRDTDVAQPAIGAVSLAMARILKRFGVEAEMTCGHSFGELPALHAAGWMGEESLLNLAVARGFHMAAAKRQGKDAGSMLAVKAELKKIEAVLLEEKLDLILANRNTPSQGVLSGATAEIDRAAKLLRKHKLRGIKLPVAAAFHSSLVEDAAAPFKDDLDSQPLTPTDVPVMSNTTGAPYTKDAKEIQMTLGNQLVHPVNFIANVENMWDQEVRTFVEVGPKTVLTGLAKAILTEKNPGLIALDASAGKKSGLEDLAAALCRIAALGHEVDLTQWEDPTDRPANQKMTLMLTGANPTPKPPEAPISKPKDERPAPAAAPQSEMPPAPQGEPLHGPDTAALAAAPRPSMTVQGDEPMTASESPRTSDTSAAPAPAATDAAGAAHAMHLVHKGLEAMQNLQAQTARAHEKFLETQAQAGQTLAAMMEQTRNLSGGAPMTYTAPAPAPVAAPVAPAEPMAAPQPVAPAAPAPVAPAAPAVPPPAPEPVAAAPVATPAPAAPVVEEAPAAPATATASPVKEILFGIVSRLTGFPVEMLEPEMDIESDLGIDSIKRVEIISELEKQLPDHPGLSTDSMGTLKTLADICNVIDDSEDAAAPAPAAAEAAPAPAGLNGSGVMPVLSTIISDLTGFPVEMLEPEMDIESDLGIDSIKRVEILSRLEQELADAPPMAPDDMARLKTIQDMVDFLDTASQPTAPGAAGKKKKPHNGDDLRLGEAPEGVLPLDEPDLLSREIRLNSLSVNEVRYFNGARITLPADRKVYITGDETGLAQAMAEEFAGFNIPVQVFELDPDTETPEFTDIAGLIIVQPQLPAKAAWNDPETIAAHISQGSEFLGRAFDLARVHAPHLATAAQEGGAFFTTISCLGGTFGLDGKGIDASPVYGGLAGLTKTAALEWPHVVCRALDLPAEKETCLALAESAAALSMIHGEVEMGITDTGCHIPTLVDRQWANDPLTLSSQDTIVITGGAKGVTAECALELAAAGGPAIALLGRSPEPGPEPDWAAGMDGPILKKEILAREFTGQKISPAQLEARFREIESNREVRRNMARIQAAGSQVAYYSTDVRDSKALETTLEQVRKDLGEITVLVHGAGVLEDKLISDKSPQAFAKVVSTKIDGLSRLLATTQGDALKQVIFFSSVAARFGNTGQCDYAMANEVLNKTAQKLTAENPGCRYLALNWGPWDGGMVNESLKKEFTRKGIELIPLAAGARRMRLEMGSPATAAGVEIVIGAGLAPGDGPKKKLSLSQSATHTLGISQMPVLDAHRIDAACVVPFAMLTELMAQGAEQNNPGLIFSGMDDVRLLKGVIPDSEAIDLHLSLSKCTTTETGFSVAAELASDSDGKALRHMSGTCLLKNHLPEPPVLSPAAFMALEPCSFDAAQAYENILFHGPALQGIQAVNGVSAKGIEVLTTLAGPTDQWMQNPLGKRWTLDPMMMDAAFQAAILWTWETRKQVCLPAYMANLRCYAPFADLDPETDKVRIRFTVNEESDYKLRGYFTFLNEEDEVVAGITGFEAIIDPALQEKFKPEPAFDRDRILAFAEGNPSDAFGPAYEIFDQEREIARLPRPPYFFMDQVLRTDHPQWEMTSGGWIEARYDVPSDAWYFGANQTPTMPFCILLEIALQPCGWLAAFAGSALTSEDRLHFRNLGGEAKLIRSVTPETGTLTMRSRMTDVSKAGGMIIQNFEMEVMSKDGMIYQGTTNFGFFSAQALANQVGVRDSKLIPAPEETDIPDGRVQMFKPLAPITPDDTTMDDDTGMPAKALRMIDGIDLMETEGGLYDKGYIRAHKVVDPDEWYFQAHFYQDPVCPGSLGVESFLQMLRYYLKEKFGLDPETHVAQMQEGQTHEWIYRGQIIPKNEKIHIHAHIKSVHKEESGDNEMAYTVIADGALVVDGICIYEMKDFALSFVPRVVAAPDALAESLAEK